MSLCKNPDISFAKLLNVIRIGSYYFVQIGALSKIEEKSWTVTYKLIPNVIGLWNIKVFASTLFTCSLWLIMIKVLILNPPRYFSLTQKDNLTDVASQQSGYCFSHSSKIATYNLTLPTFNGGGIFASFTLAAETRKLYVHTRVMYDARK